MILFVEIICALLFIYGILKSIPRSVSFDAPLFFKRSLMAFGANVFVEEEMMEQPAPLCHWQDLNIDLLRSQLTRRSDHLIVLNYDLSFGPNLAEWLSLRLVKGLWSIEELAKVPSKASDRLLVLLKGSDCQRFLILMKENPGLRDHIAALYAIDPIWDEDWMSRYFNHDDLDAEAHSAIPYVQLRFESEGALPDPPASKTGWCSINAIDLGAIDKDSLNNALTPAVALLTGKLIA